jgi:hypothetical protein
VSATNDAWAALEQHVPGPTERFSRARLDGLAGPVRRYFEASLTEGVPLAAGAQLQMRGRIKLRRWLPFHARQLLVPRAGTVWAATVATVIRGSDHYVDGAGGMDWRLFGIVPLVHAAGTDFSRSAAERAAGESIWVPTATVPTARAWTVRADRVICAPIEVDGHAVELEHEIDDAGHLEASWFSRWGDPDDTGTWGHHPFGVQVMGHATFDGVTIPNRGRAGWHFGTDRWPDAAFFEFDITHYELVR